MSDQKPPADLPHFIVMPTPRQPSPAWESLCLPHRTVAYSEDKAGLLELSTAPNGRVGVTRDEGWRYFCAKTRPVSVAKRDVSKAAAASVQSRIGGDAP
jgi:hypothetical protein